MIIVLLLCWIREITYQLSEENYFQKLWNTKDSDQPYGTCEMYPEGRYIPFFNKTGFVQDNTS